MRKKDKRSAWELKTNKFQINIIDESITKFCTKFE